MHHYKSTHKSSAQKELTYPVQRDIFLCMGCSLKYSSLDTQGTRVHIYFVGCGLLDCMSSSDGCGAQTEATHTNARWFTNTYTSKEGLMSYFLAQCCCALHWYFIHFIHKEKTWKRSHSFAFYFIKIRGELVTCFLSKKSKVFIEPHEQTQLCAFVSRQRCIVCFQFYQSVGDGGFCKNTDSAVKHLVKGKFLVTVRCLIKMLLASSRMNGHKPWTLTSSSNTLLFTGLHEWNTAYCIALNFPVEPWIMCCRIAQWI